MTNKKKSLNHDDILAETSNTEQAGLTPRLTTQPPTSPAVQSPIFAYSASSFCLKNHQNPRQPMTQTQLRRRAGIV